MNAEDTKHVREYAAGKIRGTTPRVTVTPNEDGTMEVNAVKPDGEAAPLSITETSVKIETVKQAEAFVDSVIKQALNAGAARKDLFVAGSGHKINRMTLVPGWSDPTVTERVTALPGTPRP